MKLRRERQGQQCTLSGARRSSRLIIDWSAQAGGSSARRGRGIASEQKWQSKVGRDHASRNARNKCAERKGLLGSPPIGSPGQPQRQRGRSVQRCVKTDCLVAVRGRDDKRRGPWRTGRVRLPRSHPRPRERERGSRRQRVRVGQRAESAEGERRLSSPAAQSEFGAQRQQRQQRQQSSKAAT